LQETNQFLFKAGGILLIVNPSYSMPKAESAQTYLDSALSKGSKRAGLIRRSTDRTLRAKNMEFERMPTIKETLVSSLSRIHDAYPSFDDMSEFTKQLFELDLEVGRAKQALGGLKHAIAVIKSLTREHLEKIKTAHSADTVEQVRKAYIGRIASVMKNVDKNLQVLNNARDVFRNLPSIDDTLFTVAIAGFPNVGKSTLLAKITTAKPEIKPYSFTTKGLNVGYFEYKYNKIQCIDTPGTLNRKNANPIERKAEATVKYLAHAIIYVFDPTEGEYSLEKQEALYEKTLELGKSMLVYVSKTDLVGPVIVDALSEKYPGLYTDPKELQKTIVKMFKKEYA
jgi:nucleolar GTP-binding protein